MNFPVFAVKRFGKGCVSGGEYHGERRRAAFGRSQIVEIVASVWEAKGVNQSEIREKKEPRGEWKDEAWEEYVKKSSIEHTVFELRGHDCTTHISPLM